MGQDVKDQTNGRDSRGWRDKRNRKLRNSPEGRKLRNSLDGCPPRHKNSPRSESDDSQHSTEVQTTNMDGPDRRIDFREQTIENEVFLNNAHHHDVNKSGKEVRFVGDNRKEDGEAGRQREPHRAPKRQTWSSSMEFLVVCVGYSVGLGNIWKFPYLCYHNGGGAFLIPYVLVTVLCGVPLLVLEMAMGQYVGLGVLSFWDFCPAFMGIGISYFIVNAFIAFYYIVMVAYALRYLFATFALDLPWVEWGKTCGTGGPCPEAKVNNMLDTVNSSGNEATNGTHFESPWANWSLPQNSINLTTAVSPVKQYFQQEVLSIGSSIDQIGSAQWDLVLCLMLAWVLVFLITIKGIRSLGKIAFFTSLCPIAILTTLMVLGCMGEGGSNGIYALLVPKWDKLKEVEMWYIASMQVFYSLGPGNGVYITLASYNKLSSHIVRDAFMVCLVDFLCGIFSGLAIFSCLGALAYRLDVPVKQIMQFIDIGPELVFVGYPSAVDTLPAGHLCACLFFCMLALIGLGTTVCHVEVVLTALVDWIPRLRRPIHRAFLGCVTASILFFFSLIFTTNAGMFIYSLLDWYTYTCIIMILVVLECVAFCFIFGFENVCLVITEMFGSRPSRFFRVMWKFFIPIVSMLLIFTTVFNWKSPRMGSYVFPMSSNAIGWCICILVLLPIPITFAYQLITAPGDGSKQRWEASVTSTPMFSRHILQRVRPPPQMEMKSMMQAGENT